MHAARLQTPRRQPTLQGTHVVPRGSSPTVPERVLQRRPWLDAVLRVRDSLA